MTILFTRQVLEFVDMHGNEVLSLGSFTLLPQHVVRLILVRELNADELTKFQVMCMASATWNGPKHSLPAYNRIIDL